MDPSQVGLALAPTTILTNDGLVGFRRVGGANGAQVVPDLAVTLPKPTDGGRTYMFRIRSGIRYSNGRLVRPEDFRRPIERMIAINREPLYYGAIVGAADCVARPKQCHLSKGISTDDAVPIRAHFNCCANSITTEEESSSNPCGGAGAVTVGSDMWTSFEKGF